jgi:hypothetical protein
MMKGEVIREKRLFRSLFSNCVDDYGVHSDGWVFEETEGRRVAP